MAKSGSLPADSFRCARAEFEDIAQRCQLWSINRLLGAYAPPINDSGDKSSAAEVAFPTMTETSQGRQLADGSAKVLFAEGISN